MSLDLQMEEEVVVVFTISVSFPVFLLSWFISACRIEFQGVYRRPATSADVDEHYYPQACLLRLYISIESILLLAG